MTKCYDMDDAREGLGRLLFGPRTAITTTEPCKHCGGAAAVFVALTEGCVVFPDDHTQYLCAQHWYRLTPLGKEEPVVVGLNGFRLENG